MTPLRWTRGQALRHLLASQGLAGGFASSTEALDRLVAVQSQYAASLPVALAARCARFRPTWLRRVKPEEAVKAWTLRHTFHTQNARWHAILIDALGPGFHAGYRSWMRRAGHEEVQVEAWESEILSSLAEGPKTRRELHDLIPVLKTIPMTGWGADVMGLAFRGELAAVVEEQGATRFVGRPPHTPMEIEEARLTLLRGYLQSCGPATEADFAYWAGLKARDVRPLFDRLKDELTSVEVAGMKGVRHLLGPVQSKPIPRIRLMAKFDPLTMAHRDKSLWLDRRFQGQVFRKAAQVEAVVLRKGQAAGTWRIERGTRTSTLRVEWWREPHPNDLQALEQEAARMALRAGWGGSLAIACATIAALT